MPSNKKLLQAAAGNAGGDPLYVEDVFSTYLYTGSGAARTIANGIPLSDEGGLVWLKNRALDSHVLFDTVNGPQKSLASNDTAAGANYSSYLSFPSAGTAGWDLAGAVLNGTGTSWASWTFRKAEKFFDVQTFTGSGSGGTQILSHNLGAVPAFILLKKTDGTGNWWAIHSSVTSPSSSWWLNCGTLESTQAFFQGELLTSEPTDAQIALGATFSNNTSTYVAYLFASDAGGYGDDGTESIIKCGSYTTDSSGNASVTLGFEPQWVLNKTSSYAASWSTVDMMRGFDTLQSNGYNQAPVLSPNTSNAENVTGGKPRINATGFTVTGTTASQTFIYMAIRRPMKTPEAGTEVYTTIARAGNNVTTQIPTGFTVDMFLSATRNVTWYHAAVWDRLRGTSKFVITSATLPVQGNTAQFTSFDQDGITVGPDGSGWINNAGATYVYNLFKRATGFMDVVAYTGNGTAGATQAHNLGVVPEMLIVKRRNATDLWPVYHATLGNTKYLQLNGDVPEGAWSGNWNNTTPTASVFSLGNGSYTNASSSTYVAYLFASVAGVSKVGSYTGTGSSLDVPCGFTTSARFILIRRYNYPSGGSDWYTWDSVRGISAGSNDPYLLLNDEAVEVTGTDYVDPLNAGFTVTSNASSTVNVNGGTYIFLAIA